MSAVRRRAEEAATAAAVSNAASSRALDYLSQEAPSSEEQSLQASVAVATAAGIAKVTVALAYCDWLALGAFRSVNPMLSRHCRIHRMSRRGS